MRHLTLLICSLVLLSSCRKDSMEFTSDFPHGYRTIIEVYYYASSNTTHVQVAFSMPIEDYYDQQYLVLPPEGYLKVNGTEIAVEPGYNFYQVYLEGKPTCTVEFKDFDGVVYSNTIVPVDTAYFVNLPDTLSSFNDLEVQVNAPDLDSNESSSICLDSHGYDYGCDFYYGTDSLFELNYSPTLDAGMNHTLYLYRYKYLPNKNLPFGGGSIGYQYIATKTFYTP